MNILNAAKARYTTKSYDARRTIAQPLIDELKALLRHSPSSVNSQPWHFVIASTADGKRRIASAASGAYAYNEPKILHASHVIVFASRLDMDEAHMERLLVQEEQDGRFQADGAKEGQRKGRSSFVNLHRHERKDLQHWMEKQVYLAVGTLLLGAAALGVDATPMEGIDSSRLDQELGLREQGYTSVVVVSLGYRGEGDFNARLPKSRLPAQAVFSEV